MLDFLTALDLTQSNWVSLFLGELPASGFVICREEDTGNCYSK